MQSIVKRPLIGAWHPLTAHGKDALAFELRCSFFSLGFGGKHATHVRMCRRWQEGAGNQESAGQNCRAHCISTTNSMKID